MAVASGPDEHARLQPAFARKHVSQKSIGSDIERDSHENIGAALIKLQVEPPGRDLSLEQAVARGQRHSADLTGVPGGHDLPARKGIGADEIDEIPDLVDVASVRRLPV